MPWLWADSQATSSADAEAKLRDAAARAEAAEAAAAEAQAQLASLQGTQQREAEAANNADQLKLRQVWDEAGSACPRVVILDWCTAKCQSRSVPYISTGIVM